VLIEPVLFCVAGVSVSFCTSMSVPVVKSLLSFPDQLTYRLDNDDDSEVPFCTKDNVAECLSYLNQVVTVSVVIFVIAQCSVAT